MTDAFTALIAHFKQIAALEQVGGVLGWDQETHMPEKGAQQRAEQFAALTSVMHEKLTDRRVTDWLAEAAEGDLSAEDQRHLAEAKHAHDRAVRIPEALAAEISRKTSLSQKIWAKARKNDDYAAFAPTLAEVLELKRQEADCLRDEGQSRYDALLNDFEPGADAETLDTLLGGMRPGLTALREKIAGTGRDTAPLSGTFARQAQIDLARKLASLFGYDWDAGRLDFSVHPFSVGHFDDSRITTRIDEADPFNCIYSTIHETGHAVYEQGIDRRLMFLPAGVDASMGVHESQSRFFENQIGRSRAFITQLFPLMKAAFGGFRAADAEALYRAVNRVETGFIRTEADEVHYNLHILLRFELERELVAGDLDVSDLEAEWNHRFERDFGLKVSRASEGVLQDVHWSEGAFGYFPTYALGSIYAAELDAAMLMAIPDRDAQVAAGELGAVINWLRDNIHRHARLKPAGELMRDAVGHEPTAGPLLAYLEAKFGELYGV